MSRGNGSRKAWRWSNDIWRSSLRRAGLFGVKNGSFASQETELFPGIWEPEVFCLASCFFVELLVEALGFGFVYHPL